MNKKRYIIKTSGKISDVIATLKTFQAIFGKGATLSDIEKILKDGKKQ